MNARRTSAGRDIRRLALLPVTLIGALCLFAAAPAGAQQAMFSGITVTAIASDSTETTITYSPEFLNTGRNNYTGTYPTGTTHIKFTPTWSGNQPYVRVVRTAEKYPPESGWAYCNSRSHSPPNIIRKNIASSGDSATFDVGQWFGVVHGRQGGGFVWHCFQLTAPSSNNAPTFASSSYSRSVPENSAANTNVGAVIPAATDTDSDPLTYSMEGTDASSFNFNASTRQITTKNGVTYDHEAKASYSVTIKVTDGTASATTTVTITLTDVAEPPAKPTAPSLISAMSTSLDMGWSAPTNTGKPAITSYDLQYRAGTSGTWNNGPQDETTTTAEISGLTASTSYQVRVRATNAEGDSPWSDPGTASTSAATQSNNANLSALTAAGSTSSGGTFTAFSIGTFASATIAYSANVANTITHVKLTPTRAQASATIKVGKSGSLTAVNSGSASTAISLSTGANAILVEVTAQDSTKKTYTVTITRAAANNAPTFASSSYSRSVPENSAANTNVGAVIPAATDTDSDPLTYSMEGTDASSFNFNASTRQITTKNGVTYDHEAKASYSVTIKVTDGTASATTTVTITLTDVAEPPAKPSAPTVSGGSTTSLSVSWSAPTNTGKPAITSYDLRYRVGTSGNWSNGPQNETGTTATISSLTAGTSYQVQVRATNAEGDGAWSDAGTGSTNTETNNAPTFAAASYSRSVAENTAANTNIGDAIPAATDADTGDTLVYTMEGADANSFSFDASSRRIKTKQGVSYDHEAKASYSVTIKVSDGTASDTVTVTISITDVAEPPAKPEVPTVSAASTTSLSVSWNAPSNTGKPAITGYDLRYRAGSSGNWSNGPQNQTATTATISSLTASTSYQVQVRATNAEGDGPWSDAGTASTNTSATPTQDLSVTLTATQTSLTEGSGDQAIITATLSAAPTVDLSIPITLILNTAEEGDFTGDFTGGTGKFDFPIGVVAASIIIGQVQDTDTDDETLTLTLGTLPSGIVAGEVTSLTITITDTTPSVRFSATSIRLNEGTTTTYTARLSAQPSATVTLALASRAANTGNDIADKLGVAPNNLVFTTSNWSTPQPVTLTAPTDADSDHDELHLLYGISGDSDYEGLPVDARTVKVLVVDNAGSPFPTATLEATPNPVAEGSPLTVTVSLSGPVSTGTYTDIPITVTTGTAEAADLGTLTSIRIAAGASEGTGTLTTAQDDDDYEDETFTVSLGELPLTITRGDPASVDVVIEDNDTRTTPTTPTTPTVSLSASPNRVRKGEAVTVTVRLSAALTSPVTIPINLGSNTDTATSPDHYTYDNTLTNPGITIAANATTGTATLTITPPSDTDTEADTTPRRSFTVALGSLPSEVAEGRPRQVVVTIVSGTPMEQVNQAVLPEVARAVAGRVGGAISARVGQVLNGSGIGTSGVSASLGGENTLAGALVTHAPNLLNGHRPMRDLLHDSDFVLPLNGDGSGGGSSSLSLWGGGKYTNLSGENAEQSFDGSLQGAQLGVDAKLGENLLAGLALSWSQGAFDYADGSSAGAGTGDYEIDLISLHPYFGGRTGSLQWWATAGYGNGEVEISPDDGVASTNDVTLQTLSAGGSGQVWADETGAHIRLKGEFTQTEMEIEESAEQPDSLTVSATLIRLALEARRTQSLSNGRSLTPSLSLGARHDGGDGNTGTGAEMHGSVLYDNPRTGVSASVAMHTLLGRSDYEEWGIMGMVRLAAGADGQGLSFEMSPAYGNSGGADASGSGNGRIWSNGLREDAAPIARDAGGRLEMRLGYGLSAPGERDGLLTPWSGMTLHDNGRRYRLGLDWATGGSFTLRLHGERRETAGADAEHAVLLKGEARF